MKQVLTILLLTIFLTSCGEKYEENKKLSVNNDKKIENIVTVKNKLYTKTTDITFHDKKDIEKFENDLKKINKEISSNTGSITYDQIIEKARLLDYLGKTGEALKLYIDNFENNKNDKSLAYNHNIAKLYEKLGAYDEALKRYGFLIQYFNRGDYFKDMSRIYTIMGNKDKAKIAMKGYNKAMGKNKNIEIQEVKVGESGTLELK